MPGVFRLACVTLWLVSLLMCADKKLVELCDLRRYCYVKGIFLDCISFLWLVSLLRFCLLLYRLFFIASKHLVGLHAMFLLIM